MANYKGPVDGSDDDDDDAGKKKKGKTKKKKDPNAPKGPMSSFMCFNVEIRPQLKKDNPDASFGDIVSVLFSNRRIAWTSVLQATCPCI